ncbi:Proteinase inhibitor [Bienertia sinuspersici]
MDFVRCEGKDKWPELLGKKASVAKSIIENENHLVKAIIVKQGKAVTLDYCCNRVWVWTNDAGNVIKVPIIG